MRGGNIYMGGKLVMRVSSRIRLSRREGRAELRGRGSEPLSRGHRNTCRSLFTCMRTNNQKATLGVPVEPWGNPPGVPLAPAEGHWLYYGYHWLYYG